MKLKITLFLLILVCALSSNAQDKKALSYFEKGEEAYLKRDNTTAREFYLKALERYPDYTAVYYKLGQIAYASRDLGNAKMYFEKLLVLEPENKGYVLAYTFLGTEALKANQYKKAKEYLNVALEKTREGTPAYKQIEKQILNCTYALEILEKPLVIEASLMPEVLNFKDMQYFPVFTADGSAIYYTARTIGADENIYISNKENGVWSTPKGISEVINTDFNEGTCTISADGKTMVFTSCDGRESLGSCDLFITRLDENGWSTPQNMGPNVNSPFWDSQASLSSDGKMIVFSSDRYGGQGKKDLYVSTLGEMNEWNLARNLGKVINTSKDEISPFLHANGKSLFFASEGHSGLGGFDLFLSNKTEKTMTEPLNLGYPINDGSDQFALVISADGKQAFYTKQEGEKVNMYQFDLPKELKEKFDPTFYLKGHVFDAESNVALGASIKLINLNTKEVVSEFAADAKTGEYLAVLPFSGNFGLYVEHPSYFFKSLAFSFKSEAKKDNKELEIGLDKIDKEKIEVLSNIYFDEAKWDLKPESLVELSKLSELIWRNPKLKVEISGHTDDVGTAESNQALSQKRAQSVVDYLIKEGLSKDNVTAKGYGETKPRESNNDEAGRSQNRRIELRFY
ncbi:OmpA family protein [Arcticibacterium luteifluviistationis]|uniref:Flagellar motor protein MotB n=1 Tax=Arcticibacterium luteifluviistationis TaxID=1784714 RepID=A0A2Z4G7X9_9BACT|nr:OmpA family protein [Arcticibacterium luteifluviistationis]AWV97256.1 flagellar motor protein MotB [Arcticibacterium luteifluviistationis]